MLSYSSGVGIFLYLSVHTRPYIYFTINGFKLYILPPKRSHELAFKRLSQYLKYTHDRGLVLDKSSDILKVDACTDAEFAGMYGQENINDTACSNSRTDFIITFADFPVLCIYRLQTETTLSTMEADTLALSHFC